MLRRVAAVLLVCCLTLAPTACKKETQNEQPPVYTDTTLYADGATEYCIAVPAIPTEIELYAAEELARYFEQAAGAPIEVRPDSGLELGGKYISVGNTALLRAGGVTVGEEQEDGYKLETVGDTVLIAGGRDKGVLFGVYGFLERNLGYRFYAADEIVYDSAPEKKLMNLSVSEIPSFPTRVPYFSAVNVSAKTRELYRAQSNYDIWGLFGHSYFTLLPTGKYQKSHPEWYDCKSTAVKATQLCLTETVDGVNRIRQDMMLELVENLKGYIDANPDCRYFMVGQEDTNAFCECSDCKVSHAMYGGMSGTMLRFTNEVARHIAEWLEKERPDRGPVYIVAFAYQKTLSAPAVFNGETGAYDPIVTAEPNVLIQYAPLEACYSHPMDADCNFSFREALKGWQACCGRFAIWSYCTNFTDYLLDFNNWSAIKENYRIFKEFGAVNLMDQGTGETISSPFHSLRAYVHSELMWDVEQDVNELIDGFMRAYYKDAYDAVNRYYKLMRLHYARIEADYAAQGKGVFCTRVYNIYSPNVIEAQYWPVRFLDECTAVLDEALAAAESIADSAVRQTVYDRVLAETLSVRSLYLDLHRMSYTAQEYAAMADSFEEDAARVGLVCYKENSPLSIQISVWRSQI